MARTPSPRPGSSTSDAHRDLSKPLPAGLSWGVLIVFAAAFVVAALVLALPWWLPAIYAVMSVVTFVAFLVDKTAAGRDWRRVPEQTLLLLGLACGWPGALVAQQALRHKTRKRAFLRPMWGMVALNIVAWIIVVWMLS